MIDLAFIWKVIIIFGTFVSIVFVISLEAIIFYKLWKDDQNVNFAGHEECSEKELGVKE